MCPNIVHEIVRTPAHPIPAQQEPFRNPWRGAYSAEQPLGGVSHRKTADTRPFSVRAAAASRATSNGSGVFVCDAKIASDVSSLLLARIQPSPLHDRVLFGPKAGNERSAVTGLKRATRVMRTASSRQARFRASAPLQRPPSKASRVRSSHLENSTNTKFVLPSESRK